MIIDDADRFGLSQLYQIRGRVGRREKIAYCYLLVQPQKELTEQAHKRLKAIKEFTSLGSGYKVAMRDLTIRGAGDMLGPQQAGFIDDVGLDLYLEMLASAIKKKQGKPIENKKNDKVAQVQLSGYIPKQFTDNDGDKLEIYQHIKKTESLTGPVIETFCPVNRFSRSNASLRLRVLSRSNTEPSSMERLYFSYRSAVV